MSNYHADISLFSAPEKRTENKNDVYGMAPDELRIALEREREKVRRLQTERRQEQAAKRKARAEASSYKHAAVMVNKEQWETVRRYCYTKGITQGEFLEAAIDAHLEALDVKSKRLKKIPPEGIHKGGRPRK